MSIAMPKRPMNREEFFAWAQTQEFRYEFDGFQPVAMTGGTARNSQIQQNISFALRTRLAGTGCRPLGPDAGISTVGDTVRYPDALVTCATFPDTDRLVPGAILVFEVLSPSSGRVDRIDKLREYQAVASIRRYVILEHASVALTVFSRPSGDAAWTASALTAADILPMPELSIEIPVAEFYENVDLPGAPRSDEA